MLNRLIKNSQSNPSLLLSVSYNFSLTRSLLHYIRTIMNRVRWQQNRQFTAIQTRSKQVPRSYEQANKLFISTEREISLDEKARMHRIDEILGTQTYYQQVKPYQERLDSDHVMNLEELQRTLKEKNRMELDWQNPKSDIRIKYKNKKKYYAYVSKLRTYPSHAGLDYDFSDEKNENTIKFLGNEAVYSTISLKPVQIVATSIDNQPVGEQDRPLRSKKYCYFRPNFTHTFVRIQKTLFKDSLITTQQDLQAASQHLQQVISIQEIYEILKEYDLDERVSQYLKKIQNDRLDYYFSEFVYDQTQNIIAFVIDLIGTKKQFCLIVKNLKSGPQIKPRVFFNVKPGIVFSPDSKWITFVQRSEEGGWIQLVYRPVQTCWSRNGEVIASEDQGQIIYRCSPQKQMKIGTDSNRNYAFLILKDVGRDYTQQLLLVDQPKDGELRLIQIDSFPQGCKYYFDLCPQGVIISRFESAHNSHLKYGTNSSLSHSIQLIPFKHHIQIQQSKEQIGLSGLLPGSSSIKLSFPPPSELDVANKKTIYSTEEGQFIKQIQTRESHIVLVLNIQSTYDRSLLYFLPFKLSAHPHCLVLSGGSNLNLLSNSYLYESQQVQFYKPNGLFSILKRYSIWKKQLIDVEIDWSRYHSQKIVIRQKSQNPLQINILVRSIYASEKNIPVLIYFPSEGNSMQSTVLRKYLQKGVMIVEFRGRGTFTKDLEHFLNGSRNNISNMLDDLQQLIEFIGNNMTKNISLYCKGEISSLVGLWFNIYFPFLFNSTVLHNGIYDLKDEELMKKLEQFLGPMEGQKKLNWEWFNPLNHQFKQTVRVEQKVKKTKIGTLENIILSTDSQHRIHSRKMINRIRSNTSFRYEQVYLKQYQNQYQTDLFNLAYIYSKMRERMEQQINSPPQQQEVEEIPKQNSKIQ